MNEKVILTTLGRRYTKVGASFAHWSSSKDTSWFQTSSVFSSVNRDSLRRTQVGNQVSEFLPLLLRVAKIATLCCLKIRTFWHLCPVLRAHKTTLLWPNWSYKKWYFVKFNPTVTSTWKNFFLSRSDVLCCLKLSWVTFAIFVRNSIRVSQNLNWAKV